MASRYNNLQKPAFKYPVMEPSHARRRIVPPENEVAVGESVESLIDEAVLVAVGAHEVATTHGQNATAVAVNVGALAVVNGSGSTAVVTGHDSIAASNGDSNIVAALSGDGAAAGEVGDWLVVAERVDGCVVSVVTARVDGVTVLPHVLYCAKDGVFQKFS